MESMVGSFTITQEDKQKILGENLMRAHDLDQDEIQKDISITGECSDREFKDPWITTDFEVVS